MGDTHTTADRNREVAKGLHELADFIDAHADELPALSGSASKWFFGGEPALLRATLGSTARALGDRATEKLDEDRRTVVIEGRFAGDVRLSVRAEVKLLRDVPEPDYTPILGEQST